MPRRTGAIQRRLGSTRASSTTQLIPGVSIVLRVLLRDESVEAVAGR